MDSICAAIRALPEERSDFARRVAFDLIADISTPGSVRGLLRSIEADPRWLTRIAKRSFRHTNHFDKLVLVENEAGGAYRLTLHLWSPPYSSDEIEDDQIHDHRCDFWSNVLFGSLRAFEFTRSAGGKEFLETTYRSARSHAGTKMNQYTTVGRVRLRRVRTVEHRAGTTYFLPHGQIHRIAISPSEPTATLLLRGPHLTATTSLFSNTDCYADDVTLAPFAIRELRDRFAFVNSCLPQ